MSWIRGTATNYKTMSDAILAAATGDSLQTVDSVSAGGTNYVVGEIITFTTGTFTVATQLEVVTLSGSAVATVRVYNAGVYTVAPSDSNATTSDGLGTGATFTHTYASNGWITQRANGTGISSVDSVAAAGTGYNIGDIITLLGGVYDTVATLTVATLTGGAGTGVATVTISEAGYYRAIPADPVAQSSSDGGGTGATFNLTWDDGEREVIVKGIGGGTDEIFVGWRTLSGSGYFNFELHGMTGYTSAVGINDQPGVSPGFFDGVDTATQAGSYMMCQNSVMDYWLSVTPYRIIVVVHAGPGYFNAYLGFGNRFGTSTEYPYPLLVLGHNSYAFDLSTQSNLSSGLCDPWASSTNQASDKGPGFIMRSDNIWQTVRNGYGGGSYSAQNDLVVVSPAMNPYKSVQTPTDIIDRFCDSSVEWSDLIKRGTTLGAFGLDPIPGSVLKQLMVPTMLISDISEEVLVEMDDVFWTTAYRSTGALLPEDRYIDGSDVYRIFQNCNRSDSWAFVAIKEN